MKKLFFIAAITVVSTFAAFAQNGKTEQEVLKLHKSLDEAYVKNDIAVFEGLMTDDYTISNTRGEKMNRAESLADLRKEFAERNFDILSMTSDDVKVKVYGNAAIVSGSWMSTTAPRKNANAEPHKDKGRFTVIYEKRDGKWMLVSEH